MTTHLEYKITNPPSDFRFEMLIKLELKSSAGDVEIPANHILKLDMSLHSWGHQSTIEIISFSNDDLDNMLIDKPIIYATTTFAINEEEQPSLVLKSIVTKTNCQCISNLDEGRDVQIRKYTLTLEDHAQAIWKKHHPIKLYVDETMKTVFDEHKNPKITLNYDWDILTKPHPIISFSLEHKDDTSPQVSFYDFFHWYLHKNNGVLEYDYDSGEYWIRSKKTAQRRSI